MNTFNSAGSDHDELMRRIDERVQAVRSRDVETLMSHYATDVATFDLLIPLANLGSEAVRTRVVDWLASFQSPITYELAELSLAFAGDVAFDHHLTHVVGLTKNGAQVDMWFRETVGYRKLQGQWKVVHQHSSSPVDMATGKAAFDAKP